MNGIVGQAGNECLCVLNSHERYIPSVALIGGTASSFSAPGVFQLGELGSLEEYTETINPPAPPCAYENLAFDKKKSTYTSVEYKLLNSVAFAKLAFRHRITW